MNLPKSTLQAQDIICSCYVWPIQTLSVAIVAVKDKDEVWVLMHSHILFYLLYFL